MVYEWEKAVQPLLDQIQEILPDGIVLMGVAVANPETVEAAIIEASPKLEGIAGADCWKDVFGDAAGQYHTAIENIFSEVM